MWRFFVTQHNVSLSNFVQNFRILSQEVAEKSLAKKKVVKFSLERKKGLISNMWLLFCCTIQLITIKLCTKFQNPKSSSCCEIFDRKKFTNRQANKQTNIVTEKAKTIYPLYTSYWGYKHGSDELKDMHTVRSLC